MKPLPFGIQDFDVLRREDFLYVDKTELILKLIDIRRGLFFSRPRRFGKSLLLSTFASIFKGQKDLFKGLWIEKAKYDWETYPVISFDFTEVYAHSPEMLKNSLNQRMLDIASEYQISLECDPYPAENFIRLIRALNALNKGKGVIVLVDEYDHPILSQVKNKELCEQNREILHDFFSVIKSQGKQIRFAFVTGVSKFAKVSLFSGMNNLKDISFDPTFSTLAGISEVELTNNYEEYIQNVAKRRDESTKETRILMKTWYNGYNFSTASKPVHVYNPVSLHLFLDAASLKHFWFSTATPTFAIDILRDQSFPIIELEEGIIAGPEIEEQHEIHRMNLIPLLYQTGYLTIAKYEEGAGKYHLKFPNLEVRTSFMNHVLGGLTDLSLSQMKPHFDILSKALEEHDLETFISEINSFFSDIPYTLHIQKEAYYHSLIFLILRSLELTVEPEVLTSHGRLDLVVTLGKNIYIIEFKIGSTAKIALEQIRNRGYHQKYMKLGKSVTLVGININTKQRKISDWIESSANE